MFRKRAECYTNTTDVAISVPIQSINRILILAKVIRNVYFLYTYTRTTSINKQIYHLK